MTSETQLKLSYNETSGKIAIETYDGGFFNQEIDITNEVVELVIEKLFNDMGCPPNSGVLELKRSREKRGDVVKVIGTIK
jgi:hypothetical protein